MPGEEYTYSVSRIRAKELTLLTAGDLERLLSAKDMEECFRILEEKGWEDPDNARDPQKLLSREREKLWALIGELVDDLSVFDVFLYGNDYHNLKAAIKMVYTNSKTVRPFIESATISPELLLKAASEQDFFLLPKPMEEAGREAFETLLHTGDGQLCDIILDRASLTAITQAGKKADNDLIRDYAELTVAAADLKIAARGLKTGKTQEFILKALAPCDTLNVNLLAKAASQGIDSLCEYLGVTSYSGGAGALRKSVSAFELWCDNALMEKLKPQKLNPFTIGPLAAYILARESEMKSVRMILAGKLNGLPAEAVRERLRETYV